MTKEHVIYFDIDGTLTDNDRDVIPDSVRPALQMLHDAGYLLCIATGRAFAYVDARVIDYFPWDGYVCTNGQTIYDKDKNIIHNEFMPRSIVDAVDKICNETNTSATAQNLQGGCTINQHSKYEAAGCGFLNMEMPAINKDYNRDEVLYFMVFRDNGASYDDFKTIEGAEVFPGIDSYADINIKGNNKFTGIKKSLKLLNKTKFIGIGDGLNDIEMLKNATAGIVMGNGHKDVKPLATFVTTDVDKDGLLNAAKWIIENDFE